MQIWAWLQRLSVFRGDTIIKDKKIRTKVFTFLNEEGLTMIVQARRNDGGILCIYKAKIDRTNTQLLLPLGLKWLQGQQL